jgi:acetyl esterase/lipase
MGWMLLLVGGCLAAVENPPAPKVELLWPDGAPGAIGNNEADKPSLTLFPAPADKANGAAVVVCPGGGYGGLATDHEGFQVGRWLNSFGVTAFMVKYRVAPYRHPVPLQDAQRAIRIVRSRAKEWSVDPARIGILGFSAGGHLASTAGTHFDDGSPDAKDPIDRVSCRPDFMILIYPVITLEPPYAHTGSRDNLLGRPADPALVENLCNEKQVTAKTPPTFLVHTSGDTGVPAENSILFYLALRKAKVPAEMHVYEKGQHGFGLAPGDPVLSTWPKHCEDWMRSRGLLKN